MGKFRFEVNVEPNDIAKLDDAHKRDCADAVNGLINHVFKYTMIFSIGTMAFFGLYSFFSFIYFWRMGKLLPQLPFLMPLAALAVFLLEFISGTMQRWAIIVEAFLHALIIFVVITCLQSVWIAPFALYGVAAHLKLITAYPFYKAVSEQPGYPEFTPLPTKDDIVKKDAVPNESGETAPESKEEAPADTQN